MLHPGLDIVEMMIYQGVNERITGASQPLFLDQKRFQNPAPDSHAIELRIYCENPANAFAPSPGVLQYVNIPDKSGVRIDTWVRILV